MPPGKAILTPILAGECANYYVHRIGLDYYVKLDAMTICATEGNMGVKIAFLQCIVNRQVIGIMHNVNYFCLTVAFPYNHI